MNAKLLTKEEKRVAILAELLVGVDKYDLSGKYEIDVRVITKWERQHKNQSEKDEVVELDPVVVATVVNEIKAKAETNENITPKQLDRLGIGLDKLKSGVDSLQLLETDFHNTIMNMLRWANGKINDDMKVSEWTQLVNGITTLHSTLFGKGSSTQINLMQQNGINVGSSAKVEKFKGGYRQ